MRPQVALRALGLALLLTAAAPNGFAQTQHDLNGREDAKADALDRRLNGLYGALMSRYTPADQALLRQSERSWIKYRDDDCKYEASGVIGGSIYPMIYAECVQQRTAERIKHLEYQSNCQEGDLSCVELKPDK